MSAELQSVAFYVLFTFTFVVLAVRAVRAGRRVEVALWGGLALLCAWASLFFIARLF